MKAAPLALLAAFALAATGCHELPPRAQNAEQATKTYQSRIAEVCSAKHKENIAPDAFNHLAKGFYHDMDLNSQQRVDKLTSRSCAATGATEPACYNTGFLSAIQNVGEMNHFAVYICAQPEGAGSAAAETPGAGL